MRCGEGQTAIDTHHRCALPATEVGTAIGAAIPNLMPPSLRYFDPGHSPRAIQAAPAGVEQSVGTAKPDAAPKDDPPSPRLMAGGQPWSDSHTSPAASRTTKEPPDG